MSSSYQHFSFPRLSSIDTKYHVWKLGVVFTDNVSFSTVWDDSLLCFVVLWMVKWWFHGWIDTCVAWWYYCRADGFSFCFFTSHSCIWCGTPPCPSWAITTTSSLPLICWTSPWGSKPSAPSSPLSHTTANRYGQGGCRSFSQAAGVTAELPLSVYSLMCNHRPVPITVSILLPHWWHLG